MVETMTSELPPGFESIAPFSDWALPTQKQREYKRLRSTPGEIQAFYQAMMPLIQNILVEVDRFPIGGLPSAHANLFGMALSLAEVAPNVELYGGDIRVTNSFDEPRFEARHGAHSGPSGIHSH